MVRVQLSEEQWSKVQSRAPTRLWRPGGAAAQGIGRSRGGLSTKVHLVVDALELPLGAPFATRYEKTLRNYAAVVAIGCALLWLRI